MGNDLNQMTVLSSLLPLMYPRGRFLFVVMEKVDASAEKQLARYLSSKLTTKLRK